MLGRILQFCVEIFWRFGRGPRYIDSKTKELNSYYVGPLQVGKQLHIKISRGWGLSRIHDARSETQGV